MLSLPESASAVVGVEEGFNNLEAQLTALRYYLQTQHEHTEICGFDLAASYTPNV